MNPRYIDIHGHVNFPEYEADREEVIRRAQEAGVGIHPTSTHSSVAEKEFEGVKELAKQSKVVAIGECGLDYFHSRPEEIPRQREMVLRHIELANEVDKPLMLHIRKLLKSSRNTPKSEPISIFSRGLWRTH